MRVQVSRLAAVVVGLCGWAGLAGAADAVVPVPVAAAPAAAPVFVQGQGGCSSCGGGATAAGQPWFGHRIGAGCANPVTCGSYASERTFLFGSCKQFYNPGNDCAGPNWGGGWGGSGAGLCSKCGGKCGGLGGKCGLGNCVTPILGTGGLGSHNPCVYGTNLSR